MIRFTLDRLVQFLCTRSRSNALLAIAAIALFSLFACRIEFENSVESLLSASDPEISDYQNFKRQFGEDQILAIAVPMGDVFTKENIGLLARMSSKIAALPDVRKVRSLATAQDIVGSDGSFEVIHFMDKVARHPHDLASLKAETLANPIYLKDLVSSDGKIASLLIEANKGTGRDKYKHIVDSVHAIMADLHVKEYHFAGNPIVELQMTRDMWHDLETFIPLTYVLLFGLLYFFFRNVHIPLLALFVVTLNSGFLLGLMGALGITMNGVTVGLPSLLMCIAVLSSMHMLTAYRLALARNPDHGTAMREALVHILKPCFITTLTTAAGFATISITEVVPLQQFGLVGAAATIAAYVICVLVMPFLLGLIPTERLLVSERENGWWRVLFGALVPLYRNRYVLPLCAGAILAMSVYQIPKLHMETVFLNFMNDDSTIRKSTNYIQDNLGGVGSLEIVLSSGTADGVLQPEALRHIQDFQKFMDHVPGVDKTISIVEFIKKINQAANNGDPAFYVIPPSFDQVAEYIFTYSMAGRNNDLDDFVDYEYKTTRIRVRVSQTTSVALQTTLAQIRAYADAHFKSGLQVKITSYSVIQASMMDKLIRGQLFGLGGAVLMIFAAFLIVSRSLFVAACSLVPHVLPLLCAACLMGMMGMSVNVGTAVIAGITFGLVVDDTIHFLYTARRAAARGGDPQQVIDTVFVELGPTIVYSSLILTTGFALLMLGNSFFTFSFGLLCAFSTLAAMACNTLFMPYFVTHLRSFRRFGKAVSSKTQMSTRELQNPAARSRP